MHESAEFRGLGTPGASKQGPNCRFCRSKKGPLFRRLSGPEAKEMLGHLEPTPGFYAEAESCTENMAVCSWLSFVVLGTLIC